MPNDPPKVPNHHWTVWHWVISTRPRLFSRVWMIIVMGSSGCIILGVRRARLFRGFWGVVWKVGVRTTRVVERCVDIEYDFVHIVLLWCAPTQSHCIAFISLPEIHLPRLRHILRLLISRPGINTTYNSHRVTTLHIRGWNWRTIWISRLHHRSVFETNQCGSECLSHGKNGTIYNTYSDEGWWKRESIRCH